MINVREFKDSHNNIINASTKESILVRYDNKNVFDSMMSTVTESRKNLHENPNESSNTQSNGVILTSWFTFEKDPQKGRKVPVTINYIWNFYTTCRFHGLRVVIFYNNLPPDLVTKYSTDKITFEKIEPSKSFSTNDLRFIIYKQFLEKHSHEWILMADASDVYFNSDPFIKMTQNTKNISLYLSPDIGTFESNGWMKSKMNQCYPERTKSWIHEWKLNIFNAGVWGGRKSVIQCILDCITNDLTKVVKGRGNCNMGTVNWCIRFGNCANKKDLETNNVKDLFVNPFLKECNDRKYSIIHNKCRGTEGKTCAIIRDNSISYKMSNNKNWWPPCSELL